MLLNEAFLSTENTEELLIWKGWRKHWIWILSVKTGETYQSKWETELMLSTFCSLGKWRKHSIKYNTKTRLNNLKLLQKFLDVH